MICPTVARSTAVIGGSWVPRRIRLTRASTSSGAPLVLITSSPSCSSTVVMSLSRGSKRNTRRRAASRRLAETSRPQAAASSSSATSVGSPAGALVPFAASSAELQANTTWASRYVPAAAGRAAIPSGVSRSASPAGVHTLVTCILFWVSVPVLSVQMTEVDPRVSTADSRLTRAPRRAISRTPTASASVMVGSSPSGTLATSSPMAKLIAAASPSPAARPIGKNAAPAPTVSPWIPAGLVLDALGFHHWPAFRWEAHTPLPAHAAHGHEARGLSPGPGSRRYPAGRRPDLPGTLVPQS